jgi:hypothetical protein
VSSLLPRRITLPTCRRARKPGLDVAEVKMTPMLNKYCDNRRSNFHQVPAKILMFNSENVSRLPNERLFQGLREAGIRGSLFLHFSVIATDFVLRQEPQFLTRAAQEKADQETAKNEAKKLAKARKR